MMIATRGLDGRRRTSGQVTFFISAMHRADRTPRMPRAPDATRFSDAVGGTTAVGHYFVSLWS